MSEQPGENNVIQSDLQDGKFASQKRVLGQTFFLQDSLRKIKWKITDETRVIAGFPCRRANAIIMDSIYVVAFYTDEIIAPGGPESFTGLPGMILGVALPHQHVTWFATKVQQVEVNPATLTVQPKGKKVTYKSLLDALKESTKDWGKSGRRIVQSSML
jgi:GLPGLI family protein